MSNTGVLERTMRASQLKERAEALAAQLTQLFRDAEKERVYLQFLHEGNKDHDYTHTSAGVLYTSTGLRSGYWNDKILMQSKPVVVTPISIKI